VPVRKKALKEAGPSSTITACRKVVEALALVRPDVRWDMWEETAIGSSSGGAKQILHISGVSRPSSMLSVTLKPGEELSRCVPVSVWPGSGRGGLTCPELA
jgi:DNA mismatch repair ATPase MutL